MDQSSFLNERIIINEAEIKSLDEESKLEFFIPPEEITKLDWELINDQTYEKSRNEIGELQPVYIAVNPSDPYKNDVSPYRTHLRVLDGRHKYQTSKKSHTQWKHVYVSVNDFLDFDLLRIHFASGKSAQKQVAETKMVIDQRCNYYFDIVGLPRNKISERVVKDLMGKPRFSQRTIYRYMNKKYLSNKGRYKRDKKLSGKDKEIIRLNNEIDSLQRELFMVKDQKDSLEKELEQLRSNLSITR